MKKMGKILLRALKMLGLQKPAYQPTVTDATTIDEAVAAMEHVDGGGDLSLVLVADALQQRHVAEASDWYIAKSGSYPCGDNGYHGDSQPLLEGMGFKVLREVDDLFYACLPPEGWHKTTSDRWTIIKDEKGRERAEQFYHTWDRTAFVTVKDPTITLELRAAPSASGFAVAHTTFQHALQQMYGVVPIDLDDVVSDCVSKPIHRARIFRIERAIRARYFRTERADGTERKKLDEFIDCFWNPLFVAYDVKRLSSNRILEAVVAGFTGGEEYPADAVQWDVAPYQDVVQYKEVLDELAAYAAFVDEQFQTVLAGQPSEVAQKMRFIEIIDDYRAEAEFRTVPTSLRRKDPDGGLDHSIPCWEAEGVLSEAGREVQAHIDEAKTFYSGLFAETDRIMADTSLSYEERVRQGYDALVATGPDHWTPDMIREAGLDYSDFIHSGYSVGHRQVLPSGLQVSVDFYAEGKCMLHVGRGSIEYAEPAAEQRIRVKIAVDGKKDVAVQLSDLDVVEELAAEKFGAYLVDV